jgi:adenylate cyclase
MNAIDPPVEPAGTKKKVAERDQESRRRLRHLELLLEVSRASHGGLRHAGRGAAGAGGDDHRANWACRARLAVPQRRRSTNELYSRVAQGNIQREIRILNTSGVAGHVYTSGRIR